MTADQYIQWIQDHVADEQAATHELDELVHDAKADEAADINNGGIEAQLRYLLGTTAPSASTIKEYCELLEVPVPSDGVQAAFTGDDWADGDQQAAYQEGWGLFETGQGLELQALDNPDGVAEESGHAPFRGQRFEEPSRDAQAVAYVWRRAGEGHPLAQKALAALRQDEAWRRDHPPANSDLARDLFEACSMPPSRSKWTASAPTWPTCWGLSDGPSVLLAAKQTVPAPAPRTDWARPPNLALHRDQRGGTMSDRFPALIEVGGPIPRSVVPDLLAHVRAEGLRWDWCEDAVEATTPDELLAELRQHGSEVLSVGDDEVPGGMFSDLEDFLVQHGIAFDRRSDAKYEYDGQIVFFRRGMNDPGWMLATQDGKPAVVLESLQPIRELLGAGNHQAALKELDALLNRIPLLPPLTIQEDL